MAEIAELQELIDLYIKSNPGYNKKQKSEPEIKPQDVKNAVETAFRLFAQIQSLASLVQQDPTFIEASDAELVSLNSLARTASKALEDSSFGAPALQSSSSSNEFASSFTNLASKSDISICPNGVSFEELYHFVARNF